MSLSRWIQELRSQLGDYGFFHASLILDLHGTWAKGTAVQEVVSLIADWKPEVFREIVYETA